MKKTDITLLVEKIRQIVESHELSTGAYARWTIDNGQNRDMGINSYGCADAANILYTIGEFPKDVQKRSQWVQELQNLQDPDTGLFHEATHHPIHTTAHCAGALELFDAFPKYKLTALEAYQTKEALYGFLDSLEWERNPWEASHQGAGIYAALCNAEELPQQFADWYFGWLWEEADPETGFWRKGYACNGVQEDFHHLAGSFHYLFNHEHARRPLRYPEKMIDTCLDIYTKEQRLAKPQRIGFSEIDWVYCVTRALRQCGHRYAECKAALQDFAGKFLDYLMQPNAERDLQMDDLHALFGTVCCIAELQGSLPGMIISKKPLKLVLDRRPFI